MSTYHVSQYPIRTFFPETYDDVIHSLLVHMPFLRMPCMHETLVARAEFLTLWVVGIPDEHGWEFLKKIEEDRLIDMLISFSDPLTNHEEYSRRQKNYTFIDELISNYAISITPQKIKLLGCSK